MRHAEELSTTIAPAAAKRGASAFDDVAPEENSAMSIPDDVGGLGVLDDDVPPGERQGPPGRPGRREQPELGQREVPLGEQREHHATDLTRGADDADAHRT